MVYIDALVCSMIKELVSLCLTKLQQIILRLNIVRSNSNIRTSDPSFAFELELFKMCLDLVNGLLVVFLEVDLVRNIYQFEDELLHELIMFALIGFTVGLSGAFHYFKYKETVVFFFVISISSKNNFVEVVDANH